MAKQIFDVVGSGQSRFSVNKDLSPYDMPPTFFNDGVNVRFIDGKAGKILGHSQVLGTPSAALPTGQLAGYRVLQIYGYTGVNRSFKIAGTTHSTVTRSSGAYTTLAGTTNNWQGGVLGGVLVCTNGLDVPQSFVQSGSLFTDLSDWPSTLRCKTIVPFRNHLVALNLTDSGTEKPFTIRWSDAIPAGASTNGADTWNTASTASESAETSLTGTKGHVLNALQLGNELIVYKEDSVYALNYVGGSFTFNVREKFKDTGLFSRDAVIDLGDGRHVMMATNDVLIHNGNSLKSVIDDNMKTFLFSEIDSTYFYKTFLAHNKIKNEVWICYPRTGSANGFANTALIWNYRDNTWSTRDLPNLNFATKGLVNPDQTNTWAASTGVWEATTLAWAQQEYNPAIDSLLMCGTSDTKFYLADSGTTFNGTNFLTTLERRGLHAGRTDAVKAISRVFPRIEGTGVVNISIGAELHPFAGITYSPSVPFNIGVDSKVDCRVRGRFMAIKIESEAVTQFRLSGYTVESEVVSDR